MIPKHGIWLTLGLILLMAGCNRGSSVATAPSRALASVTTAETSSTQKVVDETPVKLDPTELTNEEQYRAFLIDVPPLLLEQKYDELIRKLEKANSNRIGSGVISTNIIRSMVLEQETFDRTVADLSLIIRSGPYQRANLLLLQAMRSYEKVTQRQQLAALKHLVEAMHPLSGAEVGRRWEQLRTEGAEALKQNNLRGALISWEYALALKDNPDLRQQYDSLRKRLDQYDTAMKLSDRYLRNPGEWTQALAACQAAAVFWDNAYVAQQIDLLQVFVDFQKPRLALVLCCASGAPELAPQSQAIASALREHFKQRYDVVPLAQAKQLWNSLNLRPEDVVLIEKGRRELARMLNARYLVLGSVSAVSGLTVQARLFDLHTGLVKQTGQIRAGTLAEAMKQLSPLAGMLMLSDQDADRYSRQIAKAAPPKVIDGNKPLPPILVYDGAVTSALLTSTDAAPALGQLKIKDMTKMSDSASDVVSSHLAGTEQERPLRLRLLAIHVELGDNAFSRGRHQEALEQYELARELDPGNLDLLARVNNLYQYLPPKQAGKPTGLRPRMAVLPVLSFDDEVDSEAAYAHGLQNYFVPYLETSFEIIDQGRLNWMMHRLGITLGDIVRDQSVRRLLCRSLGVRYLIAGQIQHREDYLVSLSVIDAELGRESCRCQMTLDSLEHLKLSLPGLATRSMMSSTDRERMEKGMQAMEPELVRINQAIRRHDWKAVKEQSVKLQQAHPDRLLCSGLLALGDELSFSSMKNLVRSDRDERQLQRFDLLATEQVKTAIACETALLDIAKAGSRASVEESRRWQAVQDQLVKRARAELLASHLELASMLFDAALIVGHQDSILVEAAQCHARWAESRQNADRVEQERAEESRKRKLSAEMASLRQLWSLDRKQHEQNASILGNARKVDALEHDKLLQQAMQMKTQGLYDRAVLLLQAAYRLTQNDQTRRLLSEMTLEQVRAQTKQDNTARFIELEKKLETAGTLRKQKEALAERNWSLYQQLLGQAHEAQRQRNFSQAMSRLREAEKLFRTGEIAERVVACQDEIDQRSLQSQLNEKAKKEQEQRAKELEELLASSVGLVKERKHSTALQMLRIASLIDGRHTAVLTARKNLEADMVQRREALAKQFDLKLRVDDFVKQAQYRKGYGQHNAALALLEQVRALVPDDYDAIGLVKDYKQRQTVYEKGLADLKQEYESRRQEIVRKAVEEEAARIQLAKSRREFAQAIASRDASKAETLLKSITALETSPAVVRKLTMELTQLKKQSAAGQGEHDAKSRLEARTQEKQSGEVKQQQGRIGELLRQAQVALAKKNYDAAEKMLAEALALDATNLAVGRAQRELQAARQNEAKSKAALSANDRKKMEEEQKKKMAEFSRLMKEGKEALASEDHEKAAKIFTEAKKLNPDDPDAALFLGMAKRDSERTKAESERAEKDAEEERKREKEKAREEAASKKKADEELRRKLTMDAEAKKKSDALKAMNKQQFDEAMSKGKKALDAKKYDEAIVAYEKATQLMPDEKDAKTQLEQARKLKKEADTPKKNPRPPA